MDAIIKRGLANPAKPEKAQKPKNICPDCHGNGYIRSDESEGTQQCLTCNSQGEV